MPSPIRPNLHRNKICAVKLAVMKLRGQAAQNFKGELVRGSLHGHPGGVNE